MTKKEKKEQSSIAQNKKARFDYFIEDRLEAGLAVRGEDEPRAAPARPARLRPAALAAGVVDLDVHHRRAYPPRRPRDRLGVGVEELPVGPLPLGGDRGLGRGGLRPEAVPTRVRQPSEHRLHGHSLPLWGSSYRFSV